jgi:hypothetical protein
VNDPARPLPHAAYMDPNVSAAVTVQMIAQFAMRGVARIRRSLEVRKLERIKVLPLGWDDLGRHRSCR